MNFIKSADWKPKYVIDPETLSQKVYYSESPYLPRIENEIYTYFRQNEIHGCMTHTKTEA